MKVQVIEKKTEKNIGFFPIVCGLIGSVITEKELHDEAWRCAVEDKLVQIENRAKYRFLILRD